MVGDILQPTHLVFILVVALLVLGPKRLPEVGRTLGSGIRDFRSAINGESVDKPRVEEHPTHVASEPAPVASEPTHVASDSAPTAAAPSLQFSEPAADDPVASTIQFSETASDDTDTAVFGDVDQPEHRADEARQGPADVTDDEPTQAEHSSDEPAHPTAPSPMFAQALKGERETRAAAGESSPDSAA